MLLEEPAEPPELAVTPVAVAAPALVPPGAGALALAPPLGAETFVASGFDFPGSLRVVLPLQPMTPTITTPSKRACFAMLGAVQERDRLN